MNKVYCCFPGGRHKALTMSYDDGRTQDRRLVARHVYNQENTLTTALTCDRKLGFTTFMNDPQLAAVTPKDGQALFDDMLAHQRADLPGEWFK